MRKILLLFIAWFPCFLYATDNSTLDSLEKLIPTVSGTQKADLLNQLAHAYRISSPKTTVELGNNALAISQQEHYTEGEVKALFNIALGYQYMGDYTKAIEYHLKALSLAEKSNNKNIAGILHSIGQTYQKLENHEKTKEYYEKSLQLAKKDKNKKGIATNLYALATIYSSHDKNFSLARQYHSRALVIAKELNDEELMASILAEMGHTYYSEGNYKEAIYYQKQSLPLYLKHNNLKETARNYNNLALDYWRIKDYKTSLLYIDKGVVLAKQILDKELIKNSYLAYSLVYSDENDYKKAFEYYKLFNKYDDSIYNQQNSKQIADMQTKYETVKKEQAITLLTKENEIKQLQINKSKYLVLGLAGLVALLTFIGYLFIRQFKLKTHSKTIELEQKLLRSQMNPHFIFNCLTNIQGFIYKNDPTKAGDYLSRFAKLMRLILENSREEFIPIEKEVATLEHYLELQMLRFSNAFKYSIQIDPTIDPETMCIPPMLAQPFIENSIQHGITHIEENGNIDVSFKLIDNTILFKVEDNGVGLEKAKQLEKQETKTHRSLATTITGERLNILNKKLRKKIKLSFKDITDNKNMVVGTKVEFNIPYHVL